MFPGKLGSDRNKKNHAVKAKGAMAKHTKNSTKPQKQTSVPPKKDRAAEIANTFEWLITAFILAFVFRAFVMEAFRIPTGSMADTLMGAHFRVGCPQCGYNYERGFVPQHYRLPQDTMPGEDTELPPVRCPNCSYEMYHSEVAPLTLPVDNGDRILVLKCLYQFLEPRRWDVIVFKNPLNPAENYIKRLIGLPGEEIEIVDGDIFVDGRIARKPSKVQQELWMPIYNHDFQPVAPHQQAFKQHTWQVPFDQDNSDWEIHPDNPTQWILDSESDQLQKLVYGADSANDSRAVYAYNRVREYTLRPMGSDLKVCFYAHTAKNNGPIGAAIEKYGITYQGLIDPNGVMTITQFDPIHSQSQPKILARRSISWTLSIPQTEVQFSVVDRRVHLTFGQETLRVDLADERNGLSLKKEQKPQIAILGSGQWILSHVAFFRDIHYTSKSPHSRQGRAIEGYPFQLHEDEFFVLGDNSPNSEDGRWWRDTQMASRGHEPPRAGVVPRDYLVGKALFVYWPSGYAFPWPQSIRNMVQKHGQNNGLLRIVKTLVKLRWIPNLGRMRFIYGGAEETSPSADSKVSADFTPLDSPKS